MAVQAVAAKKIASSKIGQKALGSLSVNVGGGASSSPGPSQSAGFATGGTIIIIVGLLVLYVAVSDKFNCFSGFVNCLLDRKPVEVTTGGKVGGNGLLGAAATASNIAKRFLPFGGFF